MTSAMRDMGSAIDAYFTPEEKLRFASTIDRDAAKANNGDIASIYIPLGKAAQFADSEARWTYRLMLSHFGGIGSQYKTRLVELQSGRMRFKELGEQLEGYAATLTPSQGRDGILIEAAHAYRSGAEYDRELNVLNGIEARIGGEQEQRLFDLLLHRRPDRLLQIAGSGRNGRAFAATQYAIAHGDSKLAQQAVMAAGRSQEPVWTKFPRRAGVAKKRPLA